MGKYTPKLTQFALPKQRPFYVQGENMNKRILIISNSTGGLVNFRLELLIALCREYEVIVLSNESGRTEQLKQIGCKLISTNFDRRGTNPIKDMMLINQYKKQIKQIDPFIALTYTIKPNAYGGISCTKLGVPYIANVTGLGDSIENAGILSKISMMLYKRGLRNAEKVFFQNKTNCDFFVSKGICSVAHDVIPGSGVNLDKHCFEEYPQSESPIVISVVGRMIKDKGIEEVLEAAKQLKGRNVLIRLIGHSGEEYLKKLENAQNEGIVEYVGLQKNIHEWYKKSHAILHASYHEGMSNVLLEASACGRPVLASNIPGCIETFDEGVSGFGFKPKDAQAIVEAVERFLALPHDKKAEMGRMARKKVESEFDRNIVIEKYLTEIRRIEGERN